ncbi:MAG: alpha/beta fold hydrolase [Vicinamibacterales bacterium]|jgi:pimeloyl-ACP methyl ester carboxylesterase
MAKHATTTTRTVASLRGGERTVPGDLRSRLLRGFPVTERRLSLNRLRTAVLEGGDGSPILLLHGPAAYAAQWRRVIPDLVTTHRVIAPDLPGHGASDSIDRDPDPEFVAGWLDDLIECTCDFRPVVVGHSLGGAMAARFASQHGDRIAALVLVDALGLSTFQPAPEFGSAMHEYLSNPTPQTHDGLWRQCLADLTSVRKHLGEEWEAIKAYNLDRIQAPGRLSSLRRLMDQFGMPAIPADVLARIAVPTTLIWGREDRAISLTVAQDASERFGWPLRVIEGAADDPTLDQPELFLKTLRRVLDDQ